MHLVNLAVRAGAEAPGFDPRNPFERQKTTSARRMLSLSTIETFSRLEVVARLSHWERCASG